MEGKNKKKERKKKKGNGENLNKRQGLAKKNGQNKNTQRQSALRAVLPRYKDTTEAIKIDSGALWGLDSKKPWQ